MTLSFSTISKQSSQQRQHGRKIVKAVLVDLSGTVHIGDSLIPGAVDAIQRLRDSGRRIRFLTNTSTKSSQSLLEEMNRLGISVNMDTGTSTSSKTPHQTGGEGKGGELMTSVLATRQYLLRHNLRPYCIMEDTSDLEDVVDLSPPHNCVVVGLAPSKLHYQSLNQAFRILLDHPKLIAIHKANYYQDTDGALSLAPGGFCTALEAASNCPPAIVMGKPSKAFFESALWPDIPASETCMIGDDVLQDVQGSYDAGIGTSILVRTGKYRHGDEGKVKDDDVVSAVCDSIVDAVDYIL